jgi:hypothetical protein
MGFIGKMLCLQPMGYGHAFSEDIEQICIAGLVDEIACLIQPLRLLFILYY